MVCDCKKTGTCSCAERKDTESIGDYFARLTLDTMREWNTTYGDFTISHVGTKYLVEFATGGWSENESTISKINLFCAIKDSGGYYLMEIDSLYLSKAMLEDWVNTIKLHCWEVVELGRKSFVYKFKRSKGGW